MSCDICGENKLPVTTLREIYQTDEIKQVCPKCETEVNDHLWKLKNCDSTWIQRMLKKWMEKRKGGRDE